jgi:hypothetical protein
MDDAATSFSCYLQTMCSRMLPPYGPFLCVLFTGAGQVFSPIGVLSGAGVTFIALHNVACFAVCSTSPVGHRLSARGMGLEHVPGMSVSPSRDLVPAGYRCPVPGAAGHTLVQPVHAVGRT